MKPGCRPDNGTGEWLLYTVVSLIISRRHCPVTHSSLNKADCCRFGAVAGKEIKLEDAISEIVVADSNWELDAEGSNVDYFEEEEEEQQQLQASAKSNHRLQLLADYQPGDCLKEGTQIFILLSDQPNVNHEIVFPPSGSNSTQQLDTIICMWG